MVTTKVGVSGNVFEGDLATVTRIITSGLESTVTSGNTATFSGAVIVNLSASIGRTESASIGNAVVTSLGVNTGTHSGIVVANLSAGVGSINSASIENLVATGATISTINVSGASVTNLSTSTGTITTAKFGNVVWGYAVVFSGTSVIDVNLSGMINNVNGSPTSVVVSVNTSGFNDIHYQPTGFNSGSFKIISPVITSSDVGVSYFAAYNPVA